MSHLFPEEAENLRRQEAAKAAALRSADAYRDYINRPAAFARDKLRVVFTPAQERAAELLLVPPFRVLVPSANEQGKTLEAAAIVLWWYCTRSPAVIVTTAPTMRQVKDLLWKEIRTLARHLTPALPFQPKDCRIDRAADDFAVGVTANDATSFQGHHGPNQLFVIEEATGVHGEFFDAVETMFSPPGHAWLVIFNPTTTSARVYLEFSAVESASRRADGLRWHVVRMSALDHPNIEAELRGRPAPIPHAMRSVKFGDLLRKWSTLTSADPAAPVGSENGPGPLDVVWPPVWAVDYCKRTGQVPRVYRPGPEAEARLLGRFPSQSATAVWGDGDWLAACRELPGLAPLEVPVDVIPELGCDVARFGDDMTETHGRCGPVSLLHESAAKQPTDATAGRLMELARFMADWYNAQRKHGAAELMARLVPIKVDDDGVGGGVYDILAAEGYNAVRVSAASEPNDPEHYPNKRSELLFVTAERARDGKLDLSRLSINDRDELRRQALTVSWKLNGHGQRVATSKEDLKAELGRSPDGIDAMNLAYYTAATCGPAATVVAPRQNPLAGVFQHGNS